MLIETNKIEKNIISIINRVLNRHFGYKMTDIEISSSTFYDMGFGSFEITHVFIEIEKEYNIRIPDGYIVMCSDLNTLVHEIGVLILNT